MNQTQLASYIDHTLLKADATAGQIDKLCQEAVQFQFKSVCVNPCHVEYCKSVLEKGHIEICTVIGFPLGANTTEVKVFEARQAIKAGATELDMVINIGALKSGYFDFVMKDMKEVVNTAGEIPVKAILETFLLENREITKACELAKEAGASFVKTSTGFSKGGATPEDVVLMRRAVSQSFGVKASGGIKTYDDAIKMIQSGANRLGTSNGINIVDGIK